MSTTNNAITDSQAALITSSNVFFVASADPDLNDGPDGIGPVNLSPKGGTPLHILNPTCVAYLDYGGSGNETARHASMKGPVTVMVCSFESDDAAIVRLYGTARIASLEDKALTEIVRQGVAEEPSLKERQVVVIDVVRTNTSCGYTLPVMDFVRERRKEDRGRRYR